MATATTPHNDSSPPSSIYSSARSVFVGLIWGAFMLVVLSFWMRAKRTDPSAAVWTNVLLLVGIATLGLAFWQAFTLWLKKEPAEQKTTSLLQQRRILSLVLLAAGLGLIAFAFFLGMGKKAGGSYGFVIDNLAESFGVLVFGFIALGTGYSLSIPIDQPEGAFIRSLQQAVPILKMVLLALSIVAVGTFGYLAFVRFKQASFEWLPELATLLLFSVLSFAIFLWLNTGVPDEFGTRLLVLIYGGTTGILLFAMSIGRAFLWRQDIFLGGADAWQGENAWRFWLCAYILVASLVIMFASFNLAKADIRTNVTLRRVMYGYDTLAQALLLIGILAVVNVVIFYKFPFSFDWTKTRGAYALSDSSKNLVANLKKEANIYVLLPPNHPVYKEMRTMFDNAQTLSTKLNVHYISPDSDQMAYEKLAEDFPIILPDSPMSNAGRGVLLTYGALPKTRKDKTLHSFVADRKLFELDKGDPHGQGKPPAKIFKGEAEVFKEFKFLVQDQKKRKVYILQGNEEMDVNNDEGVERRDIRKDFSSVGLGMLVDKLTKDNFDVAGLSFNIELPGKKTQVPIVYAKTDGANKKRNVPLDCHALIVAGETKQLPAEVIDALDRYMDAGGKMLVFLDVTADSDYSKLKDCGIEPMLKRYGVELTSDFPVRLAGDDPRVLFATTPAKSANPLARQFAGKTIFMKRSARVFRASDTPGGRFKAETVLNLEFRPDRPYLLEKDLNALVDPRKYIRDLVDNPLKLQQMIHQEPIPVGVAVSETNGERPRMVVFGDAEFICNYELMASSSQLTNYAFVVSSLEWMADREPTGIGALPKVNTNFALDPSVDFTRMILLPGWLMLLGIVGLGVGIWIVRRR